MESQTVIDLEKNYVLQVYARPDFVLERGEGCRVFDSAGKEYLDCVAGIAVNSLGYGDPASLAALTEQAGKLWHVSNLYHTAPQARLAKLLCETSFADKVHYANCGASANEGAFKFARRYAREQHGKDKSTIVAFSGGFHGRLFGSLAATDRPRYRQPFEPLMPGVRFARFNDLASAAREIDDSICAVIVEPIQGEAGILPAEASFLKGLRELCDTHDSLLIFDEVQCGLGRTGHLWAYQGYGVSPDLLTVAKPLAGGLPMAAILMTDQVAGAIHAFDHASTFAGGPLVAAVAEAVVGRISQPEFLADVRAKGAYFFDRLSEINSSHIEGIRGQGLLIGIQLDIPASTVVEAGHEQGLLTVGAGANVLRLVPPLIISREEIDLVVERLSTVFSQL
ncbi:MAG: acetylornithine/succinylornithine family transaminase [Chloroflexota bacterium]|nr:acetylornithine/succinylornithine family transaminase [Chloroflexota bacterium]